MQIETGIYPVKFERVFKRDGTALDYVELSNRDNLSASGHPTTVTRHRVDHLRPQNIDDMSYLSPATVNSKRKMMALVWDSIAPAYEAWKDGNEMPETGTPLAAWGGITPDRAAAFRAAGFKSVEEIAGAGDERIAKVKLPDARRVKLAAVEWLKGRDAASMATELAELKALVAKMSAGGIEVDQKDSKAAIADLLDADEDETPKPRTRRSKSE